MKTLKTIIFSIALLTIFIPTQAQNLVPNPSFEEYTTCPDDYGEIEYAVDWHSSTTSCDLYNACSSFADVGVPNNTMGVQEPVGVNCNGYAGIFTYIENLNYREYIYVRLDSQLIIGEKYYISFNVSLADDINCGIDKIGILLSTSSLIYGTTIINNFVNYSQVYAPTPIINKISWIKISGSFVADSNYNYVNIGNFYSNSNTDTIKLNNMNCTSYYYIDDVCVSTDSAYCWDYNFTCESNLSKELLNSQINIYPNPAEKYFIIEIDKLIYKEKPEIEVYTALGKLVYKQRLTEMHTKISTANLKSGLYFVKIHSNNGITVKKLVIK